MYGYNDNREECLIVQFYICTLTFTETFIYDQNFIVSESYCSC